METAHAPQTAPGRVAGFWVRVLSDLIDAVVLGAFGFVLAIPLRGVFEHLGERGVLVGLPISLGYAGILQSRIGRGQTLGKRLLGLRVVKLDGSYLSVDRSFLRYALASFPFYSTAIAYAFSMALPFLPLQWLIAAASGLSGALIAGCFFVMPFHPLKRGIHDILTGTVVTRHGMLDPMFVAPRNDPRRDLKDPHGGRHRGNRPLYRVHQRVARRAVPDRRARDDARGPRARHVERDHRRDEGHGRRQEDGLRVGLLAPGERRRAPDWDGATKQLVGALHEDVPAARDVDFANFMLRTGFNIGIARSYENAIRRVDWRTGAFISPFR